MKTKLKESKKEKELKDLLKEEKKQKLLLLIQKRKEADEKLKLEIRLKKDVIRENQGKKINVFGRIHIIVPAIDRPSNYPANYLGNKGYVLSKII